MPRRPRLLVIDEAALGLSPTVAWTVWEATSRIKPDGTTVLMVEQNAGVGGQLPEARE